MRTTQRSWNSWLKKIVFGGPWGHPSVKSNTNEFALYLKYFTFSITTVDIRYISQVPKKISHNELEQPFIPFILEFEFKVKLSLVQFIFIAEVVAKLWDSLSFLL